MNCQEFRRTWVHDTTDADLSHIELCDDCLAWIEANFTSDEEVRFMQEYPQPSAQLEDRIMKAIYEAVVPSMPPISAAAQPQLIQMPLATKNMPRRFQIWAWVGAAGFLLAVGAFAMNGLQGVPGGSNVALNDAASGSSNTSPAGSTGANQTYSAETQANQAIAMAPEVQNQGTAETPKDSVTPDTAKAVEPASALAPQPAKAEQPVADQQAAPASPAHNKAGTNGGQQPPQAKSPAVSSPQAKEAQGIAHNRPLIAARNKNQPASAPAAANQQPPAAITALGEPVKNPAEAKAGEPASDKGIALTAPEANDPAANSATSSAANNQTNGVAESGSTNAPVIYPQAPKQPITLSTFTDVGTAVQASNLPVPSSAKLPAGFTLNYVSLQYESETSKHVTLSTTVYSRNNDQITIEVNRNEHGKRSLSIPGTFTATQLFTIDNEQAIGVSYDMHAAPASEQRDQHAVYFNTQKEGLSLYVVIKGNGVRLEDLTEMAKQLSWGMKK